jgi:hypothetical protein
LPPKRCRKWSSFPRMILPCAFMCRISSLETRVHTRARHVIEHGSGIMIRVVLAGSCADQPSAVAFPLAHDRSVSLSNDAGYGRCFLFTVRGLFEMVNSALVHKFAVHSSLIHPLLVDAPTSQPLCLWPWVSSESTFSTLEWPS